MASSVLLREHQRVVISGLQKATDLNGCIGAVTNYNEAKDRCVVKVDCNDPRESSQPRAG